MGVCCKRSPKTTQTFKQKNKPKYVNDNGLPGSLGLHFHLRRFYEKGTFTYDLHKCFL